MTKLPVGIQIFSQIIEEGCAYADKTENIYSLVNSGRSYFFSRPRRFGKSLLISTLEALFRGERELFQSTWIGRSEYSWTSFPVLQLDFSRVDSDATGRFAKNLNRHLELIASKMGVTLQVEDTLRQPLKACCRASAHRTGCVAHR